MVVGASLPPPILRASAVIARSLDAKRGIAAGGSDPLIEGVLVPRSAISSEMKSAMRVAQSGAMLGQRCYTLYTSTDTRSQSR